MSETDVQLVARLRAILRAMPDRWKFKQVVNAAAAAIERLVAERNGLAARATPAWCVNGHISEPATDGYCVNCRPVHFSVIAQTTGWTCPACADRDAQVREAREDGFDFAWEACEGLATNVIQAEDYKRERRVYLASRVSPDAAKEPT